MPLRLWMIVILAAVAVVGTACSVIGEEAKVHYDEDTRELTVRTAAERSFKYVFNKGGAVCGIYDLDIAPEVNLIGDSFQGETTDRVIQWTYWNSRFLGSPHDSGDRDVRANVTMEGCFDGKHTCEVLELPKSGDVNAIVFKSHITHWFYAELDRHGRPDFETTSRYEVLEDGSLELERTVLRRPWELMDVVVKTWDGKQWQESKPQNTTLVADQLWGGSMTSYFENWIPLQRTVLPWQRPGKGKFIEDGYKFWKPQELGGWVMAYGDKLAVAVVFGEKETDQPAHETRVVFNKQDLPHHKLNVLLPGIETDWPDHATLRQTLIFVVGEPSDVADRANRLVTTVPFPTIGIK
jgi:hypothetical protein